MRVAIIEDVAIARQRLRRLLSAHDEVEIVGEAETLESARTIVGLARPDLIFLDVTLPDGEGPDLLRDIPAASRPLVVFSTARADHSVLAFDAEAIDYLLKPICAESVDRAMRRARTRICGANNHNEGPLLAAPTSRGTDYVPIPSIEALVAQDHYINLLTDQGEMLIRGRISEMSEKLSGEGFLRVHRSVLVRLTAIRTIIPRRSGDAQIKLWSGRMLPVSRSFRRHLEAAFQEAKV